MSNVIGAVWGKAKSLKNYAVVLSSNVLDKSVKSESLEEDIPDYYEHKFIDFVNEINELEDYEDYKKLYYQRLRKRKAKMLKAVLDVFTEEYYERITLDQIINHCDDKPDRITICISGYGSDLDCNSNWNPAFRARPNDKCYVYHWPTLSTLTPEENFKFMALIKSYGGEITKRIKKETDKFT